MNIQRYYGAITLFLCGMAAGLIIANILVRYLSESPVINVHFR